MSDALLKQANSLLQFGRRPEALFCYDSYLKAHPESAEAWHNLGVTLSQMRRFPEAIPAFDKALKLRPDSAQTWANRGNSLIELKRFEEAIDSYDSALALNPEFPNARGYRLLAKLSCCDWRALKEERGSIAAELKRGARVIQPFGNLMISHEPAEQMQCAHIWTQRYSGAEQQWKGERYSHDKPRIAYVSGDLRTHPVAILLAGVLEHHDKSHFRIGAVSFGPDDGSAIRRRIASAVDDFIDVRGKNDLEAARLLREMEVDIAVDLTGLTGESRTGIFAHRPAPIQANYLGFPSTTAMAQMDYIMADRTVIPESDRHHYSEHVVYLPHSYMPNDSKRSIGAQMRRAEVELPEQGFVFAAFNNSYKFNPEMFDIWMHIVAAVDGSVLWLSEPNPAAVTNLRREAESRGVDADRIVFAPYLASNEDHLARNVLADLFLDSSPCNAHTTACDALWAGLPVVTLEGSTFAGRVGASLLKAIGLDEMIAHSCAEYESIALRFARDGNALEATRRKLKQNRAVYPLFDTAVYTRQLERAFKMMFERQRSGLHPESFAVEALP